MFKIQKSVIIILFLVFLLPGITFTAPIISNVSHDIDTGALIVEGVNFGDAPEIIIWDSFEQFQNGENIANKYSSINSGLPWVVLPGWNWNNGGSCFVTSDRSISGNNSVLYKVNAVNPSSSSENWNCSVYIDFNKPQLKELYFSYNIRYERTGDTLSQFKLPRFSAYNTYNTEPKISSGLFERAGSLLCDLDPGDNLIYRWIDGQVLDPRWTRMEYSATLSTPGQSDGNFSFVKDLNTSLFSGVNAMTREENVSAVYGRFALANVLQMNANSQGSYSVYYDNIYVSNKIARVEVGDNQAWNLCQERYVVPFSSWNHSSVTIDDIMAAIGFTEGDQIYFFIVDENGAVSPGSEVFQIKSLSGYSEEDVNKDTMIDVIDVNIVRDEIIAIPTSYKDNADVDGNGRTDAVDVQKVINALN